MIGDRIKELRLKRGWTQADLAIHAKTTTNYVRHLEKNRRPNPQRDTLLNFAHAFNLTVDELLGDDAHSAGDGPPLEELRAAGWSEARLQELSERWERLSEKEHSELAAIARDVVESRQQLERRIQAQQDRIEAMLRRNDPTPEPAT